MQIYREASKRALEMLEEKMDTYHVLSHLTTASEYASPGTVASILMVDKKGLLRKCRISQITC